MIPAHIANRKGPRSLKDLNPESPYTVKVTAIKDSVRGSDSPSAAFETLPKGTYIPLITLQRVANI